MPSAGLEARRAGTDGIHSVLSGRRGSGEIRFMVGGRRPKAGHVGFLGCESACKHAPFAGIADVIAGGAEAHGLPESALDGIARLIAHVRRFADQIERRMLRGKTIPHGE